MYFQFSFVREKLYLYLDTFLKIIVMYLDFRYFFTGCTFVQVCTFYVFRYFCSGIILKSSRRFEIENKQNKGR